MGTQGIKYSIGIVPPMFLYSFEYSIRKSRLYRIVRSPTTFHIYIYSPYYINRRVLVGIVLAY